MSVSRRTEEEEKVTSFLTQREPSVYRNGLAGRCMFTPLFHSKGGLFREPKPP